MAAISLFNNLHVLRIICLGSLAELTEGNIYDAADRYSRQNNLAYIHFGISREASRITGKRLRWQAPGDAPLSSSIRLPGFVGIATSWWFFVSRAPPGGGI